MSAPAGSAPPADGLPSPDPHVAAGLGGEWQRLHPLSPLVRTGRGVIAILVVLLIPAAGGSQQGSLGGDLAHIGVLVVVFALGLISWLVTRWRMEGGVLRVESGLIRRTSGRFPLSQIQAIDTVRPGLARFFGLAELRIRLASGSGKAGRLAYLTNAEAETLRARLLALSHGMAEETPPPPEQALLTVPPGRLFASILLSGTGLMLELAIVALLALAILAPGAAAAALSIGFVGLISLAVGPFRRFNGDYRLTVADAADGVRLRSGLVETSAETIPRGRIQAIRMIEPLAWRPFGWCRLEVDVASQKSKGRQDRNQAKSARALLPVGSHAQAASPRREGLPRPARGAPPTTGPRPLEVPAALPPPVVGGQRPLRRHDQRSAAASDRLGAAGQGAEHSPRRGPHPAPPEPLEHSSRHGGAQGSRRPARPRSGERGARLLEELPERCRRARFNAQSKSATE